MRPIFPLLLGFTLVLWAGVSFAAYPGDCTQNFQTPPVTYTVNYDVTTIDSITINSQGVGTLNQSLKPKPVTYYKYGWAHAYFESGAWHITYSIPVTSNHTQEGLQGSRTVSSLNVSEMLAAVPACDTPDPCQDKQGQPGAPIYVGMPYDAQYYENVGVCDNGCAAKPSSGPIANSYANDGSGFVIGPWTYTGTSCEEGVTESLPPQPPPDESCEAFTNACQAKCAGRAFQVDCNTGACECFGAPSYTPDPPLDPTTPTPDPGSPPVPGAQTPTPDPGGDPQLGAQIANQGKQINQGDAQLGQLGAINGKLGSIISNQAKQLGQGDTANDYARRQLGVQEEIRNKLAEMNQGEAPSLPDQPELDGSIPNDKNWTEYDDSQAAGQDQAQKEIDIAESAQTQSPFSLTLDTSGADACLSGPMMGTTVDICFNRPWMLTGYSIMQGILIGIGYLQAFMMVNRTVTGG